MTANDMTKRLHMKEKPKNRSWEMHLLMNTLELFVCLSDKHQHLLV